MYEGELVETAFNNSKMYYVTPMLAESTTKSVAALCPSEEW